MARLDHGNEMSTVPQADDATELGSSRHTGRYRRDGSRSRSAGVSDAVDVTLGDDELASAKVE